MFDHIVVLELELSSLLPPPSLSLFSLSLSLSLSLFFFFLSFFLSFWVRNVWYVWSQFLPKIRGMDCTELLSDWEQLPDNTLLPIISLILPTVHIPSCRRQLILGLYRRDTVSLHLCATMESGASDVIYTTTVPKWLCSLIGGPVV